MNDLLDVIRGIKATIDADDNHRFKSWEHCYKFFNGRNVDTETATLHLAVYLASWGMYRGSTFSLQRDYKIHEGAVKKILAYKQTIMEKPHDHERVWKLIEELKMHYMDKIVTYKKLYPESRDFKQLDTLITKILLGTLGCMPAYDKYFKEGIKKQGIKKQGEKIDCSLNDKDVFQKAFDWFWHVYDANSESIDENLKKLYPPMKIIDMYFWEKGRPQEEE